MSNSGIYPALSGASAGSQALDVLANNVANSNTLGFRAQRVGFREALSQARTKLGDQRFVQLAQTRPDTSAGPLRPTGSGSDLALGGPGFLVAQTAAGPRYLRGASLVRGANGRIVTQNGIELLGSNDLPITVPPGELVINGRGEVRVGGQLQGTLKLVEFADPTQLRPQGDGLWQAAGRAEPQAAKGTEILTGMLEGANVSPLKSMTDVIVQARHYEALHRVIETFREIDSTAARDLGSVV